MTDNFNYTLLANDQGTYTLRSTVKSFNLDHVTDKDIVSFYSSFSQQASFDTGLLPLDGTGILAIRNAGPHTQVVAQHAPGMYHVNWGAHEGDIRAVAYYVAQPYRIIIGDFKNGNLLGARMFYSPYPITSPDNILYHVNLPNINCKGYRGNGVGWICLYHNDDWSSLPFNEKVSRFIERCSGVETYNDANMSETDGPRFYESKNYPSYITNPSDWQTKSLNEGYQWTLDPDQWIPVQVNGIDNQDRHKDGGEYLTLGMAILGNYQAYYTDSDIPKMYNIVSRPDLSFDNAKVANIFKSSFAAAPSIWSSLPKDNPYTFTVESRIKNSSETLQLNFNQPQEEDEETITCYDCEEDVSPDDTGLNAYDNTVCSNCLNHNYIYIETADKYYHQDDDDVVYCDDDSTYYHIHHDSIHYCEYCTGVVAVSGTTSHSAEMLAKKLRDTKDNNLVCLSCFDRIIEENDDISTSECSVCSKVVVTSVGWQLIHPTVKTIKYNLETSEPQYLSQYITLCETCAPQYFLCPCSQLRLNDSENFNECTTTLIHCDKEGDKVVQTVSVNKCCSDCLAPPIIQDGELIATYQPPKGVLEVVVNNKMFDTTGIIVKTSNSDYF